ncbi:MAG: HD domain-containing protein [Planctomycetota bacterium]|nr:HD domain-containing protein [Planctomycetota bacterium]
MPRQPVSKLHSEQTVDQIFLLSGKQLRSNRQGNLYLQFRLSDRSGSLEARMWNASEEKAAHFSDGDYVHVQGTTQLFQGAVQLIAKRMEKVPSEGIDENEFRVLPTQVIDRLRENLTKRFAQLSDSDLRALALAYLEDAPFMEKFSRAPAGIKNHHAYHGGLLQHVATLCDLIDRVADTYPQLDRELILLGALLHDSGKVDELGYDRDLHYTDQGQLLGHIVIGLSLLDEKLSALPAFPQTRAMELKHLIVSHHGSLDAGSPQVPMTREAMVLHRLDELDARFHQFDQMIRSDNNPDSNWTPYFPNLGRKLFKGKSGNE